MQLKIKICICFLSGCCFQEEDVPGDETRRRGRRCSHSPSSRLSSDTQGKGQAPTHPGDWASEPEQLRLWPGLRGSLALLGSRAPKTRAGSPCSLAAPKPGEQSKAKRRAQIAAQGPPVAGRAASSHSHTPAGPGPGRGRGFYATTGSQWAMRGGPAVPRLYLRWARS